MSSSLDAGTLAKLQALLPNRIGDNRTWSTGLVSNLITLAGYYMFEGLEMVHKSQEISLTDDDNEYTLSSYFITIERVEYSEDGTIYESELIASTLSGFDDHSETWRNDRGTRPDLYTLLSAPGRPAASIVIYPAIATTGSRTIRVVGNGIGGNNTATQDDVQDKIVVPFVMAMLYSTDSDKVDLMYELMEDSHRGMEELRGRYRNELTGGVIT